MKRRAVSSPCLYIYIYIRRRAKDTFFPPCQTIGGSDLVAKRRLSGSQWTIDCIPEDVS
jgi:hypothetical protein